MSNAGEAAEGRKGGVNTQLPDVCLLIEGAYPYVAGGVSGWLQELISAQSDLSFHIVALVPDKKWKKLRYSLPGNVIGLSHVYLQDLDKGCRHVKGIDQLCHELEKPLLALQRQGGLQEVADIIRLLEPFGNQIGRRLLLNSEASWNLLVRMYEASLPDGSFLNYFWTWRALMGGLFATLTAPLPRAGVYHVISTGYAGLLAARAKIETGRPVVITEHGIYTNERRIELTMADWLFAGTDQGFSVESVKRDLSDIWKDTFQSYASACYLACDKITTLYGGNQILQTRDGADPAKQLIIPNGIDYDRYAAVKRSTEPRPPTVALIGRVVRIKDIKTYIRACAYLRKDVPQLQALVLGPTEEEPDYFEQCKALVHHLGLNNTVKFAGRVCLEDYLGRVDCVVLTSISEAQPLSILEAGAAGVPSVTTDVGACREMILGQPGESPALGAGGAVTPVASPAAIAQAIKQLLLDPEWHKRCSQAIQERVRLCYNKTCIDGIYHQLYQEMLALTDSESLMNREAS